jgi:hypothetical protein
MPVLTATQTSTDGAVTALAQNKMTRTAEVGAVGVFTTTHVINGIYHQSDSGTPGTRTFPSAAAMIAAIPGCVVGTSFRFIVHNADGADTLTVAVPASGTAYGTLTVAAGKNREFLVYISNVTASTEAFLLYAFAALA